MNQILEEVYNDFFGVENIDMSKKEDNNSTNISMHDMFNEIDKLYLKDDSKNLVKQIIEYMRKYNEKIEKNYIPFAITIENNDYQNTKKTIEILKNASKLFNYTSNKTTDISFYKINESIDFTKIYNDGGIIIYNNLDGFDLLEDKIKRNFIDAIDTSISESQTISIMFDTKENTNNFFLEAKNLKNKYFIYNLEYSKPDVQDIYNTILGSIDIKDDDKAKLLDYISSNISDTDDISSFITTLIRDISFNKSIPEVKNEMSMDEIFAELNELVGLKKVKKVLYDLVDVKKLEEKNASLKISKPNLHMVFLGNPGTGKTTVARIIANILYNIGFTKTNNLIEVSSKDLIGQYVGQTAPKTNEVINKAMGGVLFIDEAYTLAVKNDNSYNSEAIATLIQAMENYRDNLVVIFAGYTKEMQAFLNSNSGIASRIGYTLEFDDYTEDELSQIFISMTKKAGFDVTEDALSYLKDIIRKYKNTENFGNARFIRNIYEKTVINHAANTKDKKRKDILKTITKNDISIDNLLL